ncbi:MAG: type I DNA topoisomerase [Bifidobacteriaceae bacterium]|jgi:DNA topoisomerase-1|nr:type I DNA topoisomerase [Bifidobacteriaceae bacterium]
MAEKLVIVESPAKAKKISSFLTKDYVVIASVGHIRNLPKPSELPKDMKKGPFAKFSVNLENNFEPYYAVIKGKKRVINDIKKLLKNANELYLATDEDREGEAISWHLVDELKPKVPIKRMVFQEITKKAIEDALKNTRDLDMDLVQAQETRTILDKLFGYELSPFLWRKIKRGLSAGRVQSVATRLIVDKERDRFRFVAAEFWNMQAYIPQQDGVKDPFMAKLIEVDSMTVAAAKDFDSNGKLISGKGKVVYHLTAKAAQDLEKNLNDSKSPFEVIDKTEKAYTRKPALPYITSTLQQDASRRLRASVRDIMSAAQGLYENGFITYMRTDSPALSDQAVQASRNYAIATYGKEAVPQSPRIYKAKSKNAQEAHEAIRPAGDEFVLPSNLPNTLTGAEKELYELIFNRTIASQMEDVKGKTVTYKIQKDNAQFSVGGTTILDKGFLRIYSDISDEESEKNEDKKSNKENLVSQKLPNLEIGNIIEQGKVEAEMHATLPPARYTEASLIRKLEELSIGRPSTYASTISTLRTRGYINNTRNPLIPTWTAFAVISLLEDQVAELIDYQLTADMEESLDEIAAGKKDGKKYLHNFYYNFGGKGLHNLTEKLNDVNARDINTLDLGDGIVLRHGRFGAYFETETKKMPDGITPLRASVPDDIPPSEISLDLAKKVLSEYKQNDKVLGEDPKTGYKIALKKGKWGDYISEILPEGDSKKPKTAALFKNMLPEQVTLDQALKLLTLPKILGEHPKLKAEISVQNGRFGPYIKAGSETRSLPSEDSLFTITLDEAIELLNKPRVRGRAAASAPQKVFGADPETGKIVTAKNGRFGAYITDGETNVSIPRGKSVDEINSDEAYEMLAKKRHVKE